jgi:hypothetical protein
MTVILQDPVSVRDPAAGHAFPDPDVGAKARSILEHTLDQGNLAVFTHAETPAQATFELESHGGYARSVTGRVAYFDEQAQTYLVIEPAGTMTRVPLRDIVRSSSAEDDTGLGTGQEAPTRSSPLGKAR